MVFSGVGRGGGGEWRGSCFECRAIANRSRSMDCDWSHDEFMR